jgi:hypothetical protein
MTEVFSHHMMYFPINHQPTTTASSAQAEPEIRPGGPRQGSVRSDIKASQEDDGMVADLRKIDADWWEYGDWIRIPTKNITSFAIGLIQADARTRMKAEIKARKKRSKRQRPNHFVK